MAGAIYGFSESRRRHKVRARVALPRRMRHAAINQAPANTLCITHWRTVTINFKLGDVRPRDPQKDPMSRTWVGWDPALSPQGNFNQNRGVWALGRRVHKEKLATYSYNAKVVMVVELDRNGGKIEFDEFPDPDGGRTKFAVRGKVLGPGDADYDALIGTAVDGFRNPVTYHLHPMDAPRTCGCGCGGDVAGDRAFLPGHDQRAVHDRISQEWGTTLGFIEWFDAAYGAPGETADLEASI